MGLESSEFGGLRWEVLSQVWESIRLIGSQHGARQGQYSPEPADFRWTAGEAYLFLWGSEMSLASRFF